jgi:probable rRNA maturation factor
MVVNRQNNVRIDLRAMREFVGKLRKCLRLGRREFNVCFVGDGEIARLNAEYRGMARPTDVLSFPWRTESKAAVKSSTNPTLLHAAAKKRSSGEIYEPKGKGLDYSNFLGDIVISAETARRNAGVEKHSTANEVRWLILHGVLHLMGYDHASDRGEMTALELTLRARLGI